ncbi:hypothetical protein VUR80DRAFT_183 [Thermomyces stellatus]
MQFPPGKRDLTKAEDPVDATDMDAQRELEPITPPPATSPADGEKRSKSPTAANGRASGTSLRSHPPRHAPPRPKRAQVSRACHRCKRLQKGCSEQRPCRRCIEVGLAESCSDPSPRAVASHAVGGPPPAPSFPPTLPPAEVVDLCISRFFTRLFPTIPIMTEHYILSLRERAEAPNSHPECYGTIAALCAMVMLQVEASEAFSFPGLIHENNATFGRRLFDEAVEAHKRVHHSSALTFDHILLTFFIYACHASLSHHSRAFLFLREATTLLLLFQPESAPDPHARLLADRLFWVLLVSERSHAIRYRRPVTLQVTASTPDPDAGDPSLAGFRCLAALFRPLDTSFIALIDQEADPSFEPSPASLARVEAGINRAVDHTADLRDTQKANLRVTQLWLRIILWQLRLRLGHLSDLTALRAGAPTSSSLTYLYPLEVAREATLSTRDLPVASLAVHGVGLTEKLFDIACALVDVLSRIPMAREEEASGGREMPPEDNLRFLRRLISLLPGGEAIYLNLLLKHVETTLPELVW